MTTSTPANSAARQTYAQLLRQFISGRMTNYEYESKCDKIYKRHGQDAGVDAVYNAAWYLYCDLRKHRMTDAGHALNPEVHRIVARWILFLRTSEPPPSALGVIEGDTPVRGGPLLLFSAPVWWLALVVFGSGSPLGGAAFGVLAMALTISGVVKLIRPNALDTEPSCPAFEGESASAWPFASAEALSHARATPTYLEGASRTLHRSEQLSVD